jgi:hypothetical protein
VAGCCECGNELSVSINFCEFFHYLSVCFSRRFLVHGISYFADWLDR